MIDLPTASANQNKPGELRAELCFEKAAGMDESLKGRIISAIEKVLPGFGALSSNTLAAKPGRSGGLLLTPEGLEAGEGGAPGLSLIFSDSPTPPDSPEMLQSLSQTWQWDAAEEVLPAAPFRVTLNSVNTLELAAETRLGLFQKALYAVTRELAPKALVFPQSQCCIDPESYLENDPDNEDYFGIYGLVNTRVFTSEEDDEQSVFMDTLGMHVLGLPDVQCLASDSETDFAELAYWLYNLVEYMRETPGSFEDGDSIVGPNDEEWEVSYSNALIEPERAVLNINTMQIDLSELGFEEDEEK